MLVLLSFALVLVATVLLVLGLLSDDGLLLIYLSIASSVAAAVVLVVALKVNKPRQESAATRPTPLPEPEPAPTLVGAMAATTAASTPVAAPTGEWLASEQEPSTPEIDDEEGEEVDFPIADYDSLTVGQIMPLLPQLYPDEIDVVDARERDTKSRPEILAKLDELRRAEASAAVAADRLASYTEPAPATAEEWDDDESWFPIADYESLSAAQIRPLLDELDDEELTLVRTRELSLGRRRTLLDDIERRLGATDRELSAPAPAPVVKAASTARATAAVPATARKASVATTAARKVPAKKVPAKKPAAVSKAASAKAPVAKAPAKKTTAAKAPAKKTTAAKAPAKKAPATKRAPGR